MSAESPIIRYDELIQEAEEAFLSDPSYAIMVATRASAAIARAEARQAQREQN